jgi:DNA-binding XRE family transcriptional regulator
MIKLKDMKTLGSFLDEQAQDPDWAGGYEAVKVEVAMGIAIAKAREARHLTQRDLAAITGIKQPQLARIERGQAPKLATLVKIAAALNAAVSISPEGQTELHTRAA